MVAEKTTERIYDLVLKGGRVIDPANNVDGLFDVAIVGRFIALVDKDISPDLARTVADVTGLVVTPGLIDIHAHFFGIKGGVLPDAHCLPQGTTTGVDAGGSGHRTFDEFNDTIITQSLMNVFALINIV